MESIVVHQALYGYRDGHRLLASSRSLPSDAARTLLVLSDRSGPNLHPAFDGYLTATSLPDLPVYALCRTYDAPELPRPGCVYTHALLIEWTDLSRQPDLRWLARVHQRPTSPLDDATYLEPLHVAPEPASQPEWQRSAAETLLRALYKSPERSVVVPAESGAQWESLILAVWSQMWPRLRRHFRFSTGSMSLRGQARREFDLHVVPRTAAQRMKGDIQGLDWIDLDVPTQNAPCRWMEIATQDLTHEERTPMRNFLVQHAVDIEPQRSRFPLLADAFVFSADATESARSERLSELVEEVGAAFPLATDASRLKQTLLGPIEPATASPDLPRLLALAHTQHANAFDPTILLLSERTQALFGTDRRLALELLSSLMIEPHLSQIGQRMVELCAAKVDRKDAVELEKQRLGTIRSLVRYNISLAVLPQAWTGKTEEQIELIRTISSENNVADSALMHEIAVNLIVNADAGLANLAIDSWGQVVIDAAIEFLSDKYINKAWQAILERSPNRLLTWLSNNHAAPVQQLVFMIKLLSPLDLLILDFSIEEWSGLLTRASKSPIAKRYVKPFLLSLGLQNIHGSGAQLCANTFADVWQAVDDLDIPQESWGQLKRVLPGDDLFDMKWKRKERLAKALIGSYVRNNWPHEQFLLTLRSAQLLEDVADAVSSRWEPSPFLKEIAKEVDNGQVTATEEQWRVIKKWK